jgi:hypothetical protein
MIYNTENSKILYKIKPTTKKFKIDSTKDG